MVINVEAFYVFYWNSKIIDVVRVQLVKEIIEKEQEHSGNIVTGFKRIESNQLED